MRSGGWALDDVAHARGAWYRKYLHTRENRSANTTLFLAPVALLTLRSAVVAKFQGTSDEVQFADVDVRAIDSAFHLYPSFSHRALLLALRRPAFVTDIGAPRRS